MAWVRGVAESRLPYWARWISSSASSRPAEMDHLAAHGGQDVRAERLVPGLLGGVQGEDEVLLRVGWRPTS